MDKAFETLNTRKGNYARPMEIRTGVNRKRQLNLFDPDGTATGSGSLYRLNVPGAKKFLHKNSLCGSDDTQWMVTYVSGRSLRVAFFSGAKPLIFTPDAIANSTDLCGKFSYVR